MQFPESWLREFCNPPLTTAELAETLTMGGLEVEDVRAFAPPFTRVVVGEIKEAQAHPNADRLRVCRVDAGQPEYLQIVCGAANARVGLKTACALVGAELPPGADSKPFSIMLGKLRGVESQGMLCSSRELGLSQEHEGLLELPADAPVGCDIRTHLGLDDQLLTLKLTPNLGHCLSVFGVARELAALTGAPLHIPEINDVLPTSQDKVPVSIEARDLCGRFSGRVIRAVEAKAKTPGWMVDRLARCGQRSVTALVDISNYVMFEYGQPSHIFDLGKIDGELQVRWGRPGESLKLLNGTTVEVDTSVGVIADKNRVESLAGIMGGDATSVTDSTVDIYIEAAFWWPEAIAGRARRFNFSTDAGHRFERGVDPETTRRYIERLTALVLKICGGPQTVCGPTDDTVVNLPQPNPVQLRLSRAAKIIGMPISLEQAQSVFERLRIPTSTAGDTLTVVPPPYRFDLKIEEDLVEEVARLIGYQNLPETPPVAPIVARIRPESVRGAFDVRRNLAGRGYFETINFSFVDEAWERDYAGNEAPVRLLNPIASHLNVMRSSLLGSLLHVLRFNLDRKAARVRIFEIGRVFFKDAAVVVSDTAVEGFRQPMHVAGLCWGPVDSLQWASKERPVDFFDVKGDLEVLLAPRKLEFLPEKHPAMHPGRCAQVSVDGKPVGYLGELHPRWRQSLELPSAPVLFELGLDAVMERPVPAFAPVSKHQNVERDLAVVVAESVAHSQVMAAVHGALDRSLLRDVVLFDVYRPTASKPISADHGVPPATAEKSLAIRLTLGSDGSNLTDDVIDGAVERVLSALQDHVGARLRG